MLRKKLKRRRTVGSVTACMGLCKGHCREGETQVSLRRWHLSKHLLEGRKQAMQTSREKTFQAEETVSPNALTVGMSLVGKDCHTIDC